MQNAAASPGGELWIDPLQGGVNPAASTGAELSELLFVGGYFIPAGSFWSRPRRRGELWIAPRGVSMQPPPPGVRV